MGVAKRLSGCLRPGDTVARFGGDEFAILLDRIADADDAALVADRIQRELQALLSVDGREVPLSASMGIALKRDRVRALRGAAAGRRHRHVQREGRHALPALRRGPARAAGRAPRWRSRCSARRGEFHLLYQPVYALAPTAWSPWRRSLALAPAGRTRAGLADFLVSRRRRARSTPSAPGPPARPAGRCAPGSTARRRRTCACW